MEEKEIVKYFLEHEIRLFDGSAPGSEHLALEEEMFSEDWECGMKKIIVQNTVIPTITPFIPEKSNGIGIIVIPGGGYRRQVLNLEGTEIAVWLNTLGFTAFVLKHRLPVNNHENNLDAVLMDLQRAMRIVRSRAAEFGIQSSKIGAMGFSAGGHAASMLGTCFNNEVYKKIDEIDEINARPDFLVLGYPAISYEVFMSTDEERRNGREYLVSMHEKYSTEKMVTKETPPAFIFETNDDKTTPAENSVAFYMAARKAGVPAELHIFKEGDHGFGLGLTRRLVGSWAHLFTEWIHTVME